MEFPNPSWFLEFAMMRVEVINEGAFARLSNLVVGSGLLAWIKATRLEDFECTRTRQL